MVRSYKSSLLSPRQRKGGKSYIHDRYNSGYQVPNVHAGLRRPSRSYELTKFQEKEEKIMHPRYLILTMMVGSSMGKEDGLAHNRIVIPKYSKDEINIKKKNIIL